MLNILDTYKYKYRYIHTHIYCNRKGGGSAVVDSQPSVSIISHPARLSLAQPRAPREHLDFLTVRFTSTGRRKPSWNKGDIPPSAWFSHGLRKRIISKAIQAGTVSHRSLKWVEFCIRESSSNPHRLPGHDVDFYLLPAAHDLNIDLI